MGQLVAIVSQKGGVGKTSTAVNLGACLSAMRKRILLVGLDPQCGLTKCFGLDEAESSANLMNVLKNDIPIARSIYAVNSRLPRLFVIPSGVRTMQEEAEFCRILTREKSLLTKTFEPLRKEFDYVFFDCPPRLDDPTHSTLVASDGYLLPIQCEYASMGTVGRVLKAALDVKRTHNARLGIFGFLITMADKRAGFTLKVMREVRNYLKSHVFRTMIPRDPRLAEVPQRQEPVIAYDLDCPGAKAYVQLAREILAANGNKALT